MAPLPEELVSPLGVVDALFAQRLAATSASATPQGCGDPLVQGVPAEWGERAHFVQALNLQDEEAFQNIPCLNDVNVAEAVKPFSLVRYRCLVQDIFEPEIYAAIVRETLASGASRIVTTKYREVINSATPGAVLEDLGREGLGQRGACYCVPLPGEAAWVHAASSAANGGAAAAVLAAMASGGSNASLPATPPAGCSKRSRGDEDVEMSPDEPKQQRSAATQALAATSGGGFTSASGFHAFGPQVPPPPAPFGTADGFGLNFPLPAEERRGSGASTACIVKLYDADVEALRLCESVEILGILCVNPEIANLGTQASAEFGLGEDARQPSTALVPRLHALMVRKLPFHHPLLPFTPAWLSEARLATAYERSLAAPGAVAAARAAALSQLARHLGGDALAAEYLLMLLVAREFGKAGEKSLGAWSLNLTRWPDHAAAQALCNAASELVPRAVCLELTGETLGAQRWRPRKDFEANRLVAGQLQLAPGTLLVLDETRMVESQISADGVKALLAVKSLVAERNLVCDFTSYDVKLPLELSCLLLSQTRALIKEVDVVLPLRPTTPVPTAAESVQAGSLDAARFLMGLVTRTARALQVPDDIAEQFGNDFSLVRQQLKVDSDLCHTWMALARAHCLTHCESTLSSQRWQAVLQQERERLQRCQDDGLLTTC